MCRTLAIEWELQEIKRMVIRHSNQLLEQLTEVEEKIQLIEKLARELEFDLDDHGLIEQILAALIRKPNY